MTAKRLAALLCVFALCVTLCSCGNAVKTAGGSSLTLWGESSGVKYLQNDGGEAAASRAASHTSLEVSMVRNETEAVQLMMYAKKDIAEYNVTVSDLVCGDSIIPSSAIQVYDELYQQFMTTTRPGNPDYAGGMIPDPLLPMATAVEYGETTIAKGDNQAVLIDITTTDGTAAGLYSGVVTVTADGEEYTLPLNVKVYDINIDDGDELQTVFAILDRDQFASAELDSSDAMAEAYFEMLLKYNMSCPLPFEGNGGAKRYVELLRKYYHYDGFTSYRLYYETAGSVYAGVGTNVNLPLMQQYIYAIAMESVEDRVNYLDKAYAYFYTDVDEPDVEEEFLRAKETVNLYFQMLYDCDEMLRSELIGTDDYNYYVDVVSDTLTNIPDVIPGSYDINDVKHYGLDRLTVCPELSAMSTPADRRDYAQGRDFVDLWVYTCWGPVYPYPGGHTDDTQLSYRTIPWMCDEFNWPTYLMWSTSDYLWREHGEVITDPWGEMHTGQPRPGDGKLTYPGATYGLKGPCPSLRMVTWRDGADDYQVLNILRRLYEEKGLDASVALDAIYREIYDVGLIPNRDNDRFDAARLSLLDMIDNLKAGTDVYYSEVAVGIKEATIAFVPASSEAVVTVDGKQQTPDAEGVYRFNIDLTKQSRFVFDLTVGDKTRTYTRQLINGVLGAVESFETIGDLADCIVSYISDYKASVSEDFAHDGVKSAKLVLNSAAVADTVPYFAIEKDSALIGGSWKGLDSLKAYIYNPSDEMINLSVSYYTDEDTTMDVFELPSGQWTLVQVTFPSAEELADIDDIQEIDFNFDRGQSVTVYMDSIATVKEVAAE